MKPSVAREMWRLLEPIHAVVYFSPEAKPVYEAVGLKGWWMGYFASRSAPMGAVPAEVVIATFYNFHPSMVRRAIPDAWSFSSVERVLAARLALADRTLRSLLGTAEVGETAVLARRAAEAADPAGRPLFAGHASLPWPDEAHLVLWHAATLLREHRGDGHVALLAAEGIDACGCHLMAVAAGVTTAERQRAARGWSQEDWEAAGERLRARGLLGADGSFTEAGRTLKRSIEERTDALALPPYEALGADACARLSSALRSIADRVWELIPEPNPIGLRRLSA